MIKDPCFHSRETCFYNIPSWQVYFAWVYSGLWLCDSQHSFYSHCESDKHWASPSVLQSWTTFSGKHRLVHATYSFCVYSLKNWVFFMILWHLQNNTHRSLFISFPGFSTELDRVKNLPYCETETFEVKFDPQGANLELGEISTVLPIQVGLP